MQDPLRIQVLLDNFESIELLKQYSGGIILSGHIGNWEILAQILAVNKSETVKTVNN